LIIASQKGAPGRERGGERERRRKKEREGEKDGRNKGPHSEHSMSHDPYIHHFRFELPAFHASHTSHTFLSPPTSPFTSHFSLSHVTPLAN
jgi:hypothetical protein